VRSRRRELGALSHGGRPPWASAGVKRGRSRPVEPDGGSEFGGAVCPAITDDPHLPRRLPRSHTSRVMRSLPGCKGAQRRSRRVGPRVSDHRRPSQAGSWQEVFSTGCGPGLADGKTPGHAHLVGRSRRRQLDDAIRGGSTALRRDAVTVAADKKADPERVAASACWLRPFDFAAGSRSRRGSVAAASGNSSRPL